MKLNEVKTYFIVLKSIQERIDNVTEQISKNEIKNFEIIEAINGNEMSEEEKNHWLIPKNFYGMHITKQKKENVLGKVGCMLSHLKTLERAIEVNEFPFLICEDDIDLKIKDYEFNLIKDFNLYYLGGVYWRKNDLPITKEFAKKYNCGKCWRLDGKELKMLCTFAYFIPSKQAAEFILEKLNNKTPKRAIDVMLVREIQTIPYSCFALKEPLAFQKDFISFVTTYGKVQKLENKNCITKIEI